jgi:hypothetical protein
MPIAGSTSMMSMLAANSRCSFRPDAAGDEDAQVSDAVVGGVDDGLVVSDHVQVVAVQVGDPAQGLRAAA